MSETKKIMCDAPGCGREIAPKQTRHTVEMIVQGIGYERKVHDACGMRCLSALLEFLKPEASPPDQTVRKGAYR